MRRVPLAAACLIVALGAWANSGTLTGLGATQPQPFVWEPCRYLLNIDHFHHKAVFSMLDGAPRQQWAFSVVLRRLLYFVVGYPWMKALGFGAGGLITNVIIASAALAVFWNELRRRYGGELPLALLALLATYPGWFYWAGTPYSYAAIVPASLLAMTLLWRLDEPESRPAALGVGFALGLLSTAYDLLPFFGVAAVLLLLSRRRWRDAAIVTGAQLVAPALVALGLSRLAHVSLSNANTATFATVLHSYLPPYDLPGWRALLWQLPEQLVENFLFSNFLLVPLLFLFALSLGALRRRRRPVELPELCLLIAGLLVFVVNNAAPPYVGWPMRGPWMARLYQPVLPALAAVIAAQAAQSDGARRRGLLAAVLVATAIDAFVVFAPVLGPAAMTGWLDFRFYRQGPRPLLAENLATYGRRPIGFCASHASAAASVTH